MNATQRLRAAGQSLWLDNITRKLLESGTLARYIRELSITGLTSNPTIFDQAVSKSTDYDGANCTGDPTGNFCHFGFLELTSATNNIASVVIEGTVSDYFGIDDFRFCITPPTATQASTWGVVKGLYR